MHVELIKRQYSPSRLAEEVFESIKEYYKLIMELPSDLNEIIHKVKEGRFKTMIELKGFEPLYRANRPGKQPCLHCHCDCLTHHWRLDHFPMAKRPLDRNHHLFPGRNIWIPLDLSIVQKKQVLEDGKWMLL